MPFVVEELPDDFARHIGLEPASGWSYKRVSPDGSDVNLGFIRALPSGRSLKASCRCHAGCAFFMNVQHTYGHIVAYLIAWLAAGTACESTQAHKDHKPDLRASCG